MGDFELRTRKQLNTICCSSRSLADSSSESNVVCAESSYVVSKGSKNLINSCVGGHFCDMLAKNLAAFCLCPENFLKAKFKNMD